MMLNLRAAAIAGLLIAFAFVPAALAQKEGGVLRQFIIDSPASMSIHEETTVVAERPMMAPAHRRPALSAARSDDESKITERAARGFYHRGRIHH